MYRLLDKVNSPADIKDFSIEELKELCAEIRSYMIGCCATNPGHLGSSLGAVELIVAMHYVYDTPKDNIVFDVGHQAYAHKIITGRREAFRQNRKKDGISGFTKRAEKLGITLGPVGYESFTHIFAQAVMAHLERCRVQPAELFVCVLEVETSLLTMRMRRLMRQRAKLNTVNSDVKIPKNSRATPRRGQRMGRVSRPFRDNKFVKNINVCNSAAIKIEAPQLMHRLRGAFQLRKSHPLAAKGNSFKGFTSIRTCDAYRG